MSSHPLVRRALVLLACASGALAVAGCSPRDSTPPAPPPRRAVVLPGPEVPEGRPIARRVSQPPMALTSADGTGLRLASVVSRSIVQGPLAFTELHLAFDNPVDRTLEGRFEITLPPRATIARFAMKLDQGWQEAEVVESGKAREAYEDFLHRKQDPALLEQAAGNSFSARVFPIAARARKELIVSYAQELLAGSTPIVPLQGLPQVESLDVSLRHAGAAAPLQAIKKSSYTPEGDFGLEVAQVSPDAGVRADNLVVLRVRPVLHTPPDPLRSAVVLVDTSASRALGFEAELRLVDALVRAIASQGGAGAKVAVGAFDQSVEPIFEGSASEYGQAARDSLLARGALGASDLQQALGWAAQRAKVIGATRVVLVSDGVITAGEDAEVNVRRAAARLREAGLERLDVVAVGGLRDEALLRGLVTAGLARDGVVVDGDVAVLEQKLSKATRSGVTVQCEGATWCWPSRLDGVQPGDEFVVYAEVPEGQPVRLKIGEEPAQEHVLAPGARPLLERAWARAKLESLLERERATGATAELSREIIGLSTRHRVLSPYTSMLVLETEADYARFNLDRNALSNILVIDADQVKSTRRKPWVQPARPVNPMDRLVEMEGSPHAPPTHFIPDNAASPFGAGGLGLSGIGEGGGGRGEGLGLGGIGTLGGTGQGFGSGHGRLGGSHRGSPPQVRMGASQVHGSLPPEVIRRIVRQNYGRFRLCYEQGLQLNPNLRGRIVVRFAIDRNGAAVGPANAGSDLASAAVVACVVNAFRGLSFPKPDSGIVTVTYPMHFSPGGDVTSPERAQTPEKPVAADPYTGRFKTVMGHLAAGQTDEALQYAHSWRAESPGDVLAYVALGEASEARHELVTAARAYGSIIDLHPARADLRRFAGERLERVKHAAAQKLALDSYSKARKQRPDHPSSHRLLAYAQLRSGQPAEAFNTLAEGLGRKYPLGRFAGVERILKEDLGLVAAAWRRAEPTKAGEILARLRKAGAALESAPSLRFVLHWETDANDVDFHIYDDKGSHAYYGDKALRSGGSLYADVTTGYGPECFTIRGPKEQRSGQYTLQANYYARGPMGYGMGKLEVIDHDGNGGLIFEQRPYVVMSDRAFVNLGVIKR
jgi:tetratricopeptide (TPR) repeat protein